MFRFVRSLFGSNSSKTIRKNKRPASRRALGLEGLETRDLMAVAAINVANVPQAQLNVVAPSEVTIGISNHDLVIRGTDGPDDVKVAYKNGKYEVTVTTEVNGKAIHNTTTWRPSGGDVFFYGNRGNDKFYASFSSGGYLNVTASGGDGDDELTGSWGKDKLYGGNGSDKLIGQAGADVLDGGLGADYMDGSDGNDTIICGNDYEANDAFGGLGNDTITGSYGPDGLNGGGGNDTISGMDGDDIINGDGGADYLYGGYGNDIVSGGDGNDMLYGSQGNDVLWGGKGLDTCYGDDGNDTLYGDYDGQHDLLYGQDGRDTFRLEIKYHDPTWWQETVYLGGLNPWIYWDTGYEGELGAHVSGEDSPADFDAQEDKIQHSF
jgi:Ca2+-binding RTX toxin-like protein